MMLKYLYLLFTLSVSAPQKHHSLTVKFQNIQVSTGKIFLKVTDRNNQFITGKRLKVINQKAHFTISLPDGNYAISCFHDEDDNEVLTTNFLGIPKEPYGFSNNARGKFGPPSLKDQLFSVKNDTTLTIILR